MIAISELKESDKQREVRYRTHGSTEWGHITSWNERVIFVRYHARLDDGDVTNGGSPNIQERNGCTSEATAPEDLEFC